GNTQLKKQGDNIIAKMGNALTEGDSSLASGLESLIHMVIAKKLNVIIIYDSDSSGDTKFEVQRAAASLAFELRYNGVPVSQIRQLILPKLEGQVSTSLDDYIEVVGAEVLEEKIQATIQRRQAFPKHPNTRE